MLQANVNIAHRRNSPCVLSPNYQLLFLVSLMSHPFSWLSISRRNLHKIFCQVYRWWEMTSRDISTKIWSCGIDKFGVYNHNNLHISGKSSDQWDWRCLSSGRPYVAIFCHILVRCSLFMLWSPLSSLFFSLINISELIQMQPEDLKKTLYFNWQVYFAIHHHNCLLNQWTSAFSEFG